MRIELKIAVGYFYAKCSDALVGMCPATSFIVSGFRINICVLSSCDAVFRRISMESNSRVG